MPCPATVRAETNKGARKSDALRRRKRRVRSAKTPRAPRCCPSSATSDMYRPMCRHRALERPKAHSNRIRGSPVAHHLTRADFGKREKTAAAADPRQSTRAADSLTRVAFASGVTRATRFTAAMSDGAMALPAKENALFKQVVRCYETKTYKKGLKTADAILKKFPNHGETLSMKGLLLGNMEGEGKREEAHECVKLGLKNDVGSHVCWHVYGLLHRIDRNYKEAIKCYRQALKIDEGNTQILRDLSYMQMQTREMDEFIATRNEILKLRPGNRVNWMSIVVAQHYAGDHAKALETMKRYEETVAETVAAAQGEDPKTAKFELSETYMFKAKMLEDAGRVEDALASLQTNAGKIVDRAGWMAQVGTLHLRLAESKTTTKDVVSGEDVSPAAHRSKAASVFRRLVDRMPDNHEWHALLVKSLDLESDATGLKRLYAELVEKHPGAEFCARAPLDFLHGADFVDALRAYITKPLRKGVPSLFREIAGLYSDEHKTSSMGKVFTETATSLREKKAFPGSSDTETKPDATLAHALTLLAYHHDKTNDREAALVIIDEAIALDVQPPILELRLAKASFLKRSGDYSGAVAEAQVARNGDLADRYLNGACVKRLLQNGEYEEAEKTAALFARDGDQASNLYDMQCAWFENEAGWCHLRAGRRGRALKYFAAVIEHYEQMEEDQFDFHNYCMRKMTLRSYVEMLKAEDALYDKPRFREAARGLITTYVSVHDDPPADAAAAEEAALAALSKEERQKARKKQKAAKERAEKEAAERAEKEAAERAAAAEAAAKEGKKPPAKSEKPPDPDPLGEKLLATKTPLEDALKALALLEKHASHRAETHDLAFSVYVRQNKLPLALRALKRGVAADSGDFATRRNVVFLASKTSDADPSDRLAALVVKGVSEIMESAGAGSLNAYVELMLEQARSPSDVACAAEACAAARGAEAAENKKRLLAVVGAVSLDGVSAKQCASALARVRAVDAAAGEALRVKCASAFPRGEAFKA